MAQISWQDMDVTAWAGTDHAVAGVQYCLEVIERHEAHIHAFEQVFASESLTLADELDRLPVADRGPLHGVPVAIKAENDVTGIPTTFGTIANNTPAEVDSAVVHRLKAAGAIILGTTRMPECGAWPVTESQRHITPQPLKPSLQCWRIQRWISSRSCCGYGPSCHWW